LLLLSLNFHHLCTETHPSKIYTLSLHDALPIWKTERHGGHMENEGPPRDHAGTADDTDPYGDDTASHAELTDNLKSRSTWLRLLDRKSTRLNSSHVKISYAVFCLKKKNKIQKEH